MKTTQILSIYAISFIYDYGFGAEARCVEG